MKPLFYIALGILIGVLGVFALTPNLDKFIGYQQSETPIGNDVTYTGEASIPDTVIPVIKKVDNPKNLAKIDSLQKEIVRLWRVKQRVIHDTLWNDTTIYLPDTTQFVVDKFVSTKLFKYPYADFTVSAISAVPVDQFRDDKVDFYFDRYLKDKNYIKNPKTYFGLTAREWKVAGGSLLIYLGIDKAGQVLK